MIEAKFQLAENDKTIEMSNGYGIIIVGVHKGTCFLKKEKAIKGIDWVDLPEELKEQYRKYVYPMKNI